MTFRTLAKNITIQGPVRISIWDDESEIYVQELTDSDGLFREDLKHLFKYPVKYMFVGGDGVLHIELVFKEGK